MGSGHVALFSADLPSSLDSPLHGTPPSAGSSRGPAFPSERLVVVAIRGLGWARGAGWNMLGMAHASNCVCGGKFVCLFVCLFV